MKKTIITVVGRDTVGIIAKVCTYLADHQVNIEDIRAVLAEKSQDGKSKEVKALLNQYGVAKLSTVAEKDYPGLLQKAKAL